MKTGIWKLNVSRLRTTITVGLCACLAGGCISTVEQAKCTVVIKTGYLEPELKHMAAKMQDVAWAQYLLSSE